MITREADGTIHTHAGPEIGVASTKAFTAQMTALYLLALYLARFAARLQRRRSQSSRAGTDAELPVKLEQLLTQRRRHRRAGQGISSRHRTFSISAAAFTFPSRWKAR